MPVSPSTSGLSCVCWWLVVGLLLSLPFGHNNSDNCNISYTNDNNSNNAYKALLASSEL